MVRTQDFHSCNRVQFPLGLPKANFQKWRVRLFLLVLHVAAVVILSIYIVQKHRHTDVRKTMIYTMSLRPDVKPVKSPLDLMNESEEKEGEKG